MRERRDAKGSRPEMFTFIVFRECEINHCLKLFVPSLFIIFYSFQVSVLHINKNLN